MRTDGIRTIDDIRKRTKTDADGCWIWTRSINSAGYGTAYFSPTKRIEVAHRLAWILKNGSPGKLHVLHKCDVRACCNPAHLFLGTNADNVRDRDVKGRGADHAGEKNGRHKLTADAIPIIKAAVAGGLSQDEVAKFFGVRQATISRVVRGLGWSDVKSK